MVAEAVEGEPVIEVMAKAKTAQVPAPTVSVAAVMFEPIVATSDSVALVWLQMRIGNIWLVEDEGLAGIAGVPGVKLSLAQTSVAEPAVAVQSVTPQTATAGVSVGRVMGPGGAICAEAATEQAQPNRTV